MTYHSVGRYDALSCLPQSTTWMVPGPEVCPGQHGARFAAVPLTASQATMPFQSTITVAGAGYLPPTFTTSLTISVLA